LSEPASDFEQSILKLLSKEKTPKAIVRLAGDASNRAFFRVSYRNGPSVVVMAYQGAVPGDDETFLEIQRFLSNLGLPVPAVYSHHAEEQIVVLEDLGDDLLETVVERSDETRVVELYKQAVNLLLTMRQATMKLTSGCQAFQLAFDEEKLMQEMDFFMAHFVRGLCRAKPSNAALAALNEFFAKICATLASEPRIFTHRDYHARNLMLHSSRLVMIDFQDARMGPAQYDLASLLRDSYVTLREDLVDDLVAYYAEATGNTSQELRHRFRYIFDVMSLQRNIKALGTFGYQASAGGERRYLKSVPRTGGYIARNIGKYEEFASFRTVIEDVICSPAAGF
jgi:aminoglycoside/choline kinase family phosphotransferase